MASSSVVIVTVTVVDVPPTEKNRQRRRPATGIAGMDWMPVAVIGSDIQISVKLVPPRLSCKIAKTADAFWISLNVADGNGDNHDTTFFVPADDYARFARAANAFNAALNEPAVADALAAPTLIAAE